MIEHDAWPAGVVVHQPYIPESDGGVDLFTHAEHVNRRFLWQSPPGVGNCLARTFVLLTNVADGELSFHAAWSSTKPDRELDVSVDDLAGLARSGRIDKDILHRVRRAAKCNS